MSPRGICSIATNQESQLHREWSSYVSLMKVVAGSSFSGREEEVRHRSGNRVPKGKVRPQNSKMANHRYDPKQNMDKYGNNLDQTRPPL